MSSPEEITAIQRSKILMVGAGGIGCELLKTLVSSGFKDIHVIDMDTIEVSNLNRQFLFRKFHVGQSKAKVARESLLKFRPDVNIVAHHANIKDKEFDIEFYQKFNVVLNGLDNLDARRHVNRLCLAAKVPLVESGTAGYLGQVTVHIKGRTECYECQEKPPPKTYPICTITSTPSKPVHCIVWAKELAFTKLFGDKTQAADLQLGMVEAPLKEEDSTAQPRLQNGEAAIDLACRIFDQIFGQNIEVALKNEDAWKTRRKPSALYIQEILPGGSGKLDGHDFTHSSVSAMTILGLHDPQKVWNIEDSARVFLTSVRLFFEARSKEIGSLAFDKDDKLALEFVTAAANLRAYSFGIPMLSLFDVKGIAGNIVHAIATTNAIIAGLIVLEAVKILTNNLADSRSTYFLEHPSKNMLLMPVEPFEPNSRCYVCSQTPLVLEVNTLKTKFRDLIEKIVKRKLGVNSPIVMHESNVLYETGEDVEAIMASNYENNLEKILAELSTPVINGTVLRIEDFDQDFTCTVHIKHRDDFDEEKEPDGMLIHDAAIASMPSNTQPNAGNEAKVDGDGDDLEVVSMEEVITKDRKRKLEEASCSDEKKLKLQLSPKEVL